MARLPLFHEFAVRAGDRESFNGEPAAAAYLLELARRIREPESTADEREAAAKLLERLAGDPRGWRVAGLVPARRPRNGARDWRISRQVVELVESGESVTRARARVARRSGLSVSRVKAVHLAYERARKAATWHLPPD